MGWGVGTRENSEGMIPELPARKAQRKVSSGHTASSAPAQRLAANRRGVYAGGQEGNLGVREDSRLCLEFVGPLSTPWNSAGPTEANGYP